MSGGNLFDDPFEAFEDAEMGEDTRDEPDGADFQVERVLQERDKAIQIVMSDTGDVHWVPKSVLHTDSEVVEFGDSGRMVVHEWFAKQEKWL